MNKYIEQEIIDIIRLKNSENVSNITFFKLLEHFGTVANSLKAIPELLAKGNNKRFKIYPLESALSDLEECKAHNIELIPYSDLRYPVLLQHIEDKPPLLYVKGNLELLSKISITLVGTRHPSLNGINLATKFASELGNLGLLTASGMALGIDTAVHKASLKTGTAAFLGSGINVVYPKENKNLYNELASNGLLISEFGINSEPVHYNFPKRNRLLSGFSYATIVIEAAVNSGSLITARLAVEQNREVFAVPANPNDINSQGTNKLLKEGAYLLENINDIMGFINKWKNDNKTLMESQHEIKANLFTHVDDNSVEIVKNKLLSLLSHTPVSLDLLNQEVDLSTKIIALAILELELSGKVIRYPGNKIALT